MNGLQKVGVWALVLLLIGALVYIIILQARPIQVPPGKLLVDTAIWNELERVANRPPDTVQLPPVVEWRERIIYRDRPIPVPVEVQAGLSFLVDSLINDSTYIIISDTLAGVLISREVEHRPRVITQTNIIYQPAPYPVPYEVPASPRAQWYITGGLGTNWGPELGLEYMGKERWGIGVSGETDFERKYLRIRVLYKIR